MNKHVCIRAVISMIAAVLLMALPAWAAQGTVDSAHSGFAIASASLTTVSLTNTSAGDAVLVMVFKNSTSNRTHTVTDDLGNSYTLIGDAGTCSSDRCVQLFANHSVTGSGTRVVSVQQSSTLVSYAVLAFKIACSPDACEADQFSSLVQSATTSHFSSAGSTVIDTAADSVVVAGCLTGASTGTISGLGTYETLSESSAIIHAMFEDDVATALTDERGAWTSASSVSSWCLIASVKSVVVTPTVCPDTGTNDFFDCLSDFDGVVSGGDAITVEVNAMRSSADVASAVAVPSATHGNSYNYSGDTYANKQDAAKVVIPALSILLDAPQQARFPIDIADNDTGDTLFVWDTWKANEWLLGSLVCAGNGSNAAQKAWQFAARKYGSSPDPDLFFQLNDLFGGPNQVAAVGVAPTGTIAEWAPVTPVAVSAISSSGTTATATATGHPFADNQIVTIAGATNTAVTKNISSISAGTNPVVTTTSAHNLTGTFDVRINGESPNIIGSSPQDFFIATVTGASTFTIQNADGNINLSSATTGGTATLYPFSKRNVQIHVTDSNHFEYPLSVSNPGSATGSAIYALGDPDTQVTGTDCFTVDARRFPMLGPHAGPAYSGEHLRAQIANFIGRCKEWVRYWVLFEPDQGSAWTCGADSSLSGHLDLVSMWMASEGTAPVQIFDRVEVEFDRPMGTSPTSQVEPIDSPFGSGQCATHTNLFLNHDPGKLLYAWWEHNSSGGGCNLGISTQMLGYDKNYVMVHTPQQSGVITASSSSITVDGIEVLVQPVPAP